MFDSIEDFIDELRYGLENWLSSHSKEGYIENVLYNCAGWSLYDYYCKQVFINKIMDAKENYMCNSCYTTWFIDELLDYNRCPDCYKFCALQDRDMIGELVDGCYSANDTIDILTLSEKEKAASMSYDDWVSEFPYLLELIDENESILDQLNYASMVDDPGELLAIVLMGCHSCHYSGAICDEYCDIPYEMIDKISKEGLESVFDIEDINSFLGI